MGNAIHSLHTMWMQSCYINCTLIPISGYLLYKTIRIDSNILFRNNVLFFLSAVLFLFTITPLISLAYSDQWPIIVKYTEFYNACFSAVEVFIYYTFFKLLDFTLFKKTVILYIVLVLILIFILMAVDFWMVPMPRNLENKLLGSILLKKGEILDVFKLIIIASSCIVYFFQIFKRNQKLIFHQVLVVYALFSYCVCGILTFSIAVNIRYYKLIKHVIMIFPCLSFVFLCISLFLFVKENDVKATVSMKTISD
jgi:hypothetical protein